MKFAYADPPYFGQGAKLYGKLHAQASDWDTALRHTQLITQLTGDFPDGWAMSLSTSSLRLLLPMCPAHVRVAAWVKPFCAFKKGVRPCYAWEPVIYHSRRNPPHEPHLPPIKGGVQTTPKDYLAESITLQKGLTGAKPFAFCMWVLDLLNLQPEDALTDLFPGTGIMSKAVFSRQFSAAFRSRAVQAFKRVTDA